MAKSYELITEEMITRNLDIVKAFQLQLKIKTLEIWKKDSIKDIFTTSILKEIKENKIIKEFDINTGDLTIDDSQILNYEDFKTLKENNNKKIKSLETTILHLKSEVNIWILNFILNWTLEMKTTKYQEMFATDIHNLEEILEIKDWNEQIKTNDDFNAITLKMAPKIKSTLEYILETIKNDKHNNNTIKLEFWKEKIQQFTVIKKIETTILWNFMAKGYDNVSFLRIDTDKLEIEKLLDSTTFHKKKIVENLPNEKELQTMIKAKFNYFTEKKFDFMNFDIIFNFHIVNKQIEEWKLTAIKESNKKSKNKQKHIKIFLYNLNLLKDSIFKFTNEQFINRFTNKIEEINSKEKRFNENKLFSTTLDSFIKETEKTYSFVDISPIEDLILQTSTIPELIPNVSHQGIEIQQSIVLNQISQKQQKEDIKQFMIDKGLEEESTATDKKQIKKKKKRQSSKNTTQFKQENLETSVSFTNKDKQNLTNVKSENKAELITKPNPISQENNIAIPSTSKESKTHNASQKLDEPQEIITKETEQFKKLNKWSYHINYIN
ncbi:hypothetical protein [Spiroplasma sp. AdecLV25b]|uniref:hypothetical protein n=1 Tax=Spiroplasma sp. AdecLV25b TaxID=3027162 RepID=UPI0027E04C12|nr:hypothetical protein [Spiroplasma sp. AdecLV25b]